LNAAASGQDFAVAPVTGLFGKNDTSTTVDQNYAVTGGSGTTKLDQRYVQETWTANGKVNFKFTPISGDPCNPTAGALRIYLLETLKGDLAVADLNSDQNQVSLGYDDCPPYEESDLKPMPYCLIDPGPASSLATTGVLPPGATSCIVSSSQNVVAGAQVHFEYHVYTAFDGGRGVG
jgi:hypothetical protein